MSKRLLIILFLCLFIVVACNRNQHRQEPTVLVKTAMLQKKTLSTTISGYGVVTVNAADVLNIILPVAGQITSLPVTAGQLVKKGDILVTLSTDPTALLGYQQALTAFNYAKNELKRTQQLFQMKLATRSQLAAAEQAVETAQSNLQTQLRIGTNKSTQIITAPYDGIVITVVSAIGDQVAAGISILQVAKRNKMIVQLGVEPADSHLIQPDMPAQLFPLNIKTPPIGAKVDKVYGMLDPITQLVNIYIKLNSTEDTPLLPGMHLRGLITVKSLNVWSVPRSSVLKDEKGAYIFQVQNQHAVKIQVNPVIEQKGYIGIQGKLLLNAPVVILGNYELQNGMAIRE